MGVYEVHDCSRAGGCVHQPEERRRGCTECSDDEKTCSTLRDETNCVDEKQVVSVAERTELAERGFKIGAATGH